MKQQTAEEKRQHRNEVLKKNVNNFVNGESIKTIKARKKYGGSYEFVIHRDYAKQLGLTNDVHSFLAYVDEDFSSLVIKLLTKDLIGKI